MEFWVTREFVMEAIRWRGESETPDAAAAISSGVPGGPPDGNRVEPGPLTEKEINFQHLGKLLNKTYPMWYTLHWFSAKLPKIT